MARATVEQVLKAVAAGDVAPVYLVSGDLVLAEPAAVRLAEALAEKVGCEVEAHRRPARLAPLLADLKTYSLFAAAKVVLAVDAAIFADRTAAAELIDQAAGALPIEERAAADAEAELGPAQREGASRLLQALRVFGLEAGSGEAAEVLASLPKWALQGGKAWRKKHPRGRGAKQVRELAGGLAALLEAARHHGLVGFAEGDLAELGAIVQGGLPEGHALVLAEHSVAADHPVVKSLEERGTAIELGRVAAGKRGDWQGLDALLDQLARETGAAIARDAAAELARRTLRQTGEWKARKVDGESTARFAGEYRKLASLAAGGRISREQVEGSVEDRGEEDVWKIFDAVGSGRGDEALGRFRRMLAAADDAMAARLSFFALLAGFCRQLTAVAGVARIRSVPPGVQSYRQFQSRWVSELQGELPDGGKNPIAGLHPFRLHRAYLAASRMDRARLAGLPWRVLETEMQIKGESSEPDTAIAHLLAYLAAAVKR